MIENIPMALPHMSGIEPIVRLRDGFEQWVHPCSFGLDAPDTIPAGSVRGCEDDKYRCPIDFVFRPGWFA